MYSLDLFGRMPKLVAGSSNVSSWVTTGINIMATTKSGQLKAHTVAGKIARLSMSDFFQGNRQLTEEEQEIDWAIEDHREAKKDARRAFWLAIVLYFAGLFISGGEDGSRRDNIGTALILCGILTFGVHLWLDHRAFKKRLAVQELMDPYLRKKALPFYQELVEMFADKPGIHLHLSENGTIVVSDKRRLQGEGKING